MLLLQNQNHQIWGLEQFWTSPNDFIMRTSHINLLVTCPVNGKTHHFGCWSLLPKTQGPTSLQNQVTSSPLEVPCKTPAPGGVAKCGRRSPNLPSDPRCSNWWWWCFCHCAFEKYTQVKLGLRLIHNLKIPCYVSYSLLLDAILGWNPEIKHSSNSIYETTISI